MTGEVFGISFRTHFRENLPQKLARLFQALEPGPLVRPGSLWAVKMHFGEAGGHGFIRPHLVRGLVEALKNLGARPFLTDTVTLYPGGRSNAVGHLETALAHGFGREVTGAPLVIADGLRGEAETAVAVERGGLDRAWVAAGLAAAEGLLVLSHFKGHELTGFGGALKNLGVGGASLRGKLALHTVEKPAVTVKRKKCRGCGGCPAACPAGAIALAGGQARIAPEKCLSCAQCLPVCPAGALGVKWADDAPGFMRKMAESARAVLSGKGGRAFFINFLNDVSPMCDCLNHSDAPFAPDLGVLASRDPVALDLASAELINQAPGRPGGRLAGADLAPGADKWAALHPGRPWPFQLEYAEEIGLGSRDYGLTWLPEAPGVEAGASPASP
jgi:uncharacterized Fe-S center protein